MNTSKSNCMVFLIFAGKFYMKMIQDLLNKILLEVEENDHKGLITQISIDGYTQEQVDYHVKLLVESGFLEGSDGGAVLGNTFKRYYIKGLTIMGHQAIADLRKSTD